MNNKKTGRVLLTGAAGFIGSHLARRLLHEGYEVVGIDNLVTGSLQNVAPLKKEPKFDFLQKDVIPALNLPRSFDWVMHFASPASPPKYLDRPVETLRVNGEGTFHLLESAKKMGARFFLASTSEIYGDPEIHPQPESYKGNVSSTGPRSVYDEGKRYAEALVMAYHRYHKVSTRLIRIFNTYGPSMDANDGRVVTNFINQALQGEPLTVYGSGKQTRSLQYIDDLIEGIIRLMAKEYHDPVNLGNPDEYTVLELANIVKELTKSRSRVVFSTLPQDDPKRRQPDIRLAKQLLGWEPKIPLRQGLLQTIDYFREKDR
ncbi:MAG: SDR family oxidoreductase [Deltaproteobacteria bacterium]|nr:SDR family oxidoreductase [Deltaproteobacteria bacterium]